MSKDRKQIILQSLAKLLEERDATKVTTAVLAAESGVTEAALYRHFPSKRSIFLELFTFCDQTIFQKVGEIKKDADIEAEEKVRLIYFFYAIFLERNKGFARILSLEALGPSEQNVRKRNQSLTNTRYYRTKLKLDTACFPWMNLADTKS